MSSRYQAGRYPRNDALVRVLSILRLLEQRGRHTLDELATRFSVTTRTIRRDLKALEDVGYPIGHEERCDNAVAKKFGVNGTWWLA